VLLVNCAARFPCQLDEAQTDSPSFPPRASESDVGQLARMPKFFPQTTSPLVEASLEKIAPAHLRRAAAGWLGSSEEPARGSTGGLRQTLKTRATARHVKLGAKLNRRAGIEVNAVAPRQRQM
jgi:hypothetical protein